MVATRIFTSASVWAAAAATALALANPANDQDMPAPTTSKVDPALVGMWKLAMPGLSMFWQIRADGSYRYFGVNARPFEHWGTIEASGGHWATRWLGGQDGGSYTVSGNTWQETGKAGTGNWQRVWKPGDGGSTVQCALIDVAEVEALFGSATQGRADATTCTVDASGVGYSDSLHVGVIENAAERFAIVRKNTGQMRPIVDVPGLGNSAYIDEDSVHILKGNRYVVMRVKMYPDQPEAVSNEALIRLARSVAARI
jgi:hypothetical protein